ncbi:MAG: hypothetical protein CMN97_06950 [Synechococcus sp. NAT40]|nr:hypothetical protein [Synechococcus sp. NAT40]
MLGISKALLLPLFWTIQSLDSLATEQLLIVCDSSHNKIATDCRLQAADLHPPFASGLTTMTGIAPESD